MNTNLMRALLFVSVGGCGWDEGLLIQNLHGRVVISQDQLIRQVTDADGNVSTLDPDVRSIGPIYLGLFASVYKANVLERFPYPEVGPQYLDGVIGNTYPYGGTTIGDLRYPCEQSMVCKTTSGRFKDYDDIVDWFNRTGIPLTDDNGVPITDGETIQQTCYQLLNVTSDSEIRITAYEDHNGDGKIDEKDLDFVDDGDGNFVADFTIFQQEMFWDQNQKNCIPGHNCKGFSLWGWMDAPSTQGGQEAGSYSTCDSTIGFLDTWYNSNFYGGASFVDTLNFPSKYLGGGDITASEGYVWSDMYDEPDLYLDFVVN